MEKIINPMFTYQYGDVELDNLVNHDHNYDHTKLPHITLTDLISKIKNHDTVEAGTFVYITMHDLVNEHDTRYMHDTYTHIQSDTRIEVEYDEQMDDWTRIFIILDDKRIWIGDEPNDEWNQMTSSYGDINAFELEAFQEWT